MASWKAHEKCVSPIVPDEGGEEQPLQENADGSVCDGLPPLPGNGDSPSAPGCRVSFFARGMPCFYEDKR